MKQSMRRRSGLGFGSLAVLVALTLLASCSSTPAGRSPAADGWGGPDSHGQLDALLQIHRCPLVTGYPMGNGPAPQGYERGCVENFIQGINANPQFPGFPRYPALRQITSCSMVNQGMDWGYDKTCVDAAIDGICGQAPLSPFQQCSMVYDTQTQNAGYNQVCIFNKVLNNPRLRNDWSRVESCPQVFDSNYRQSGFDANCVQGSGGQVDRCYSQLQPWTPPGQGLFLVSAWYQGNASFTISGATIHGQHEIRPGAHDHTDFNMTQQSFSGEPFPTNRPVNVGVQCIDRCRLVQLQSPNASNGFTTRVLINDTEGGRNTVRFFVYWQ